MLAQNPDPWSVPLNSATCMFRQLPDCRKISMIAAQATGRRTAPCGIRCSLEAKVIRLWPFQPSRNLLLSDRYPCLGRFVHGKFRRHGESSDPGKNAGACQNWPAFALPAAYTLLVQQAFQLMGFTMARRPEAVAGTPVSQYEWETKSTFVQHRPHATSFSPLGWPVNPCEAEDAS